MTAEILTDMAGLIDGGDQQISAQLALAVQSGDIQ